MLSEAVAVVRSAVGGHPRSSTPIYGSRVADALRRSIELRDQVLHVRSLRRNDFLYVQGEPGDALFIVCSGWMKRTMSTATGKVSLIDIHVPAEMVGEASLADRRRQDSVVAMSACQVLVVPHELLVATLRDAAFVVEWTQHLSSVLRAQQELIAQFVTMDSRERLMARLAMLAERLAGAPGDAVELPKGLTQEDLAAMVGTTRSRVGVFLREFEDTGLISRSERGIVVDPGRLARCLAAEGLPARRVSA